MAKLKLDGRELRLINLSNARNRDLVELQVQSGLGLKDITDKGKASEIFTLLVVSFLTQHNAGFTVKWDDLLDMEPKQLGEPIREPGDDPDEVAEDPTQTGSQTPESEPVANGLAETV